tara:strand:- start:895 stop:1290 length:396 start_codon:yes stop_codon:yes gene_type:complete
MNRALNDAGNCHQNISNEPQQLDWITEQSREDEALHQQIVVETSEYIEATQYLVSTALTETSEGKAAAQVLLSITHADWKISLSDLNYLSYKAFHCVLVVMRGMFTLLEKPAGLIENGLETLSKIEKIGGS